MKKTNFYSYHIRKWYTFVEETYANETGRLADGDPVFKLVIAATIQNPYAGIYSENLDKIIMDSTQLGAEFGQRVTATLSGRQVLGYGKACLVGMDGEYEHGNAFLTNAFADPIRAAVGGGKAWFPSTGKRGPGGTIIDIPLAHKDALYVRSHYDTISTSFTDSPAADEVVVIVAAATRGRLYARLGGIKPDEVKGEDGLV